MQINKRRRFSRKQGAALVLSICLVGGAAFAAYYTMNRGETVKEQEEQYVALDE